MGDDGFVVSSGSPSPFPLTSAIGEVAPARAADEHGRLGFLQYYELTLCDQVSLMAPTDGKGKNHASDSRYS